MTKYKTTISQIRLLRFWLKHNFKTTKIKPQNRKPTFNYVFNAKEFIKDKPVYTSLIKKDININKDILLNGNLSITDKISFIKIHNPKLYNAFKVMAENDLNPF